MSMIRLRQLGQNLLVSGNGSMETIVFPKSYNFEKLFALAFKWNQDNNQTALSLFNKELNKFRKIKEKNPEVVEKRIERKKISKEIKKIQSFDYNSLPLLIPSSWKAVLDSQEDNQHIKNFLLLLSLNPNKYTRDNILNNLSSKYPFITSNGYLVLTRQVWKTEEGDVLHDFVQSSYTKIKGQKKGVKNYYIAESEGKFSLVKVGTVVEGDFKGYLDTLYNTHTPQTKTVYCSNYNKNKPEFRESWSIGDVVKIDTPDFDNEICGTNRLHVKTDPQSNINNQEYGDTTVIVLVNPRDIISIRESWKLTCSQFKICAIVTDEEIQETFVSDFQHFDYDYIQEDFEEIKKLVNEKSKDVIDTRKSEDKKLIKGLKASITNRKAREILAEDFNKILQQRVQTI